MLKDKIIAAAQDYIQEYEGIPATAKRWKLIGADHHKLIASVMVSTDQDCAFEVWVIVNLDTEKVEVTA